MQLYEYRTVGRPGLRVSPLTLGTMTFGDPGWGSAAADYPYPWLATIAVALTQSGTQINGIGSSSYIRQV